MSGRYGDGQPVPVLANTWTPTGAIGKHFMVAECIGSFEYEIRLRGRIIGAGAGLKAGFGLFIPEGFDSILLKCATAQTVLLIISDDRIDYNRVTGTITTTGAALTPTHGGNAAVPVAGITITPGAGTVAMQLTGDPANSDMIWPSGTIGQGTPVQPGCTISWPVGAAISPKAGSGTQALYWTLFAE